MLQDIAEKLGVAQGVELLREGLSSGALLAMGRERAGEAAGAARAAIDVLWRSEVWRDAPDFVKAEVAALALRHGVHVGSIHALHAAAHPERLALVDERRRLSYKRADERINQLCYACADAVSTSHRPRVLIFMENRVEYALVWFALFRLGWAAVHASDSSTEEELRYLFEHSGAQLAFCSAKTRARAEAAAPAEATLVVTSEGSPDAAFSRDFDDFCAGWPTTYYRSSSSREAAENVVYTSGTTGKPKGTVRDFAKMGPLEAVEILERLPVKNDERHLVVARMYHSAGQAFTLMMAALGATIILKAKFDAADVVKTMHGEKITSMFMVPTMIRRILDLPDEVFRRYPPQDLRCIVSGAAPFPQPLRERAIHRFGAGVIHDFYGASELGWVTLINGFEMLERPGSQGRALRGQHIRVIDSEHKLAPPGEVGLIQVQTRSKMDGYLNNREATEEIQDEGWMTVEDTGYLDEDGYLYITGRARDMIISGGVNIYPVEIEDVLGQHPEVVEVAVVGLNDEEWGEKVAAVVVMRSGELLPAELEEFARVSLAGFKVPRAWFQVDELPRNHVGKVLKRELRERFS